MPIFKRCSRCGKRIPEGTECSCVNKRYKHEDRYRADSKEHKFYISSQWAKKRRVIYEKFCGMDIYSLYKYGRIEKGRTVHHIVPLKDDWTLRYDSNNLILLTEQNHRRLHQLMKQGEKEKRAVIKELQGFLIRFKREQGEV